MVSCRCFVAKLWWQRAVSGAGRAGGRKWGGGDFPLSCPPWEFSTDTFVILPREKVSVKEKVDEFCPPPCSSGWRCVAHIIVLSYMIVAYYIIIWYINYRALIALIFLCITAMWWHFFLKFSKHCLYLNVSLSFLLYILMLKLFAICSWAMGKAVVNCKYQSGFCVCYCLYHYAPIHGSR